MSQPDWAKIVSYAHQHNGQIIVEPETPEDEKESSWSPEERREAFRNKLRREINLDDGSGEAISNARNHLQSRGVVRSIGTDDMAGIELTSDGFKIAHERELAVRNSQINQSLSVFTLILVIITGIDVVPFEGPVKALLVGGILVALLVYLRQADALEE